MFIDPILEVDKFAEKATKAGERFSGIEVIFAVAVSMDSINANPYYYEDIIREIEGKRCAPEFVISSISGLKNMRC